MQLLKADAELVVDGPNQVYFGLIGALSCFPQHLICQLSVEVTHTPNLQGHIQALGGDTERVMQAISIDRPTIRDDGNDIGRRSERRSLKYQLRQRYYSHDYVW